MDFERFLDRYDGDGTLFYLDPPYWGCEGDYGKALFSRADFKRLANRLVELKGRFILSINDVPEVREVFAAFEIEALTTTYSIGEKPTAAAELLVTNF